MDDTVLRQRVLKELANAPMIESEQIRVTVEGGVVTLSGRVRTYAERAVAERVTLRVRGVRGVVVRLVAVKPPFRPPEVKDINLAVFRRSATNPKTIRVRGNPSIPVGGANVRSERTKAERHAWSVPGLRTVEDRPTLG